MNQVLLIKRDFIHYKKAFLAVFAGALISTAVLTGALILGDSVNYSLRHLTAKRLGKIRYAMHPEGRFFSLEMARDISERTGCTAAPAMLSAGIAINPEKSKRLNNVQVIGIDNRFTKFWENPSAGPDANSVLISRNTAEKLGLKPGDDLLLRVYKQSLAPANAPFAAVKSPMAAMRFRVAEIVKDDQMGLFSLNNNQSAPYNVFISLEKMAVMLELKGMANLLLLPAYEKSGSLPPESLPGLIWKPRDAGIGIHPLLNSGIYEMRSDRIFIDDSLAKAAGSVIPGRQAFLTYLVNSFTFKDRSTPYSFITAASPDFLGADPGPGGMIINSWLAADLKARKGDTLRIRYFIMSPRRLLGEDSSVFVVRQIRPINDGIWDPSLMPDFPGMSKAGNCRDWETDAPIDLKKIRKKDEDYWNTYRGTPKAFISLADGQKLFANPFGRLTSIRFNTSPDRVDAIGSAILKKLNPGQQGFAFRRVYDEAMNSSSGLTDFASLFLSLSAFIIFAALLLFTLMFSLHIQTRMKESGILSAIGFKKQQIFRIILAEGMVLAAGGGIAGALSGILYNGLMLLGLNTIWQDAVGITGLEMNIRPLTLATGALAGTIAAIPLMFFILRHNLRKQPWQRISAKEAGSLTDKGRTLFYNRLFGGLLIICSILFMSFLMITARSPDSSLFLIAGALMIAGGAFAMNSFLISRSQAQIGPAAGFVSLSLKNAGLNRSRSMTVIGLLALGTFSIFITGANHRTFSALTNKASSGTGGFLFWAETSIPLRYDPDSPPGKKEYVLEAEPCLKKTRIYALQRLEGDDASCLNLNRAVLPSVLSIPCKAFDRKGVFSFLSLQGGININHPWLALQYPPGPDIIPAFADQTVITWGLQKKTGDTIFIQTENGRKTGLKLIGGLENSVFQGYLLVSDSLFRIHFPSVSGYTTFLIDAPSSSRDSVAAVLEKGFRDYGISMVPAGEKLASFNAVENTYLSVFLLLGALGLLMGTLALGLVLLRNMLERKQELAIYLALGFNRRYILKLVMTEYLIILFAGVCLGMVSAMTGILPSLLSPASHSPVLLLLLPAPAFLLNGLFWVWLSAKAALRRLRSDGLSKGLAM
ncbi:MAG: FtsX-like permease family protein [Bacteroidetes bacterium]|nr:FtsX-like permease family protein [Bacteroidota bacterium]